MDHRLKSMELLQLRFLVDGAGGGTQAYTKASDFVTTTVTLSPKSDKLLP